MYDTCSSIDIEALTFDKKTQKQLTKCLSNLSKACEQGQTCQLDVILDLVANLIFKGRAQDVLGGI